jgi:hypothetical protein
LSGCARHSKKSGTAEVSAFVSLQGQGAYFFSKEGDFIPPLESPAPVTQVTGVAAQGGWVKEFLPRTRRGKNELPAMTTTIRSKFI